LLNSADFLIEMFHCVVFSKLLTIFMVVESRVINMFIGTTKVMINMKLCVHLFVVDETEVIYVGSPVAHKNNLFTSDVTNFDR
jgi:hypothetical protein